MPERLFFPFYEDYAQLIITYEYKSAFGNWKYCYETFRTTTRANQGPVISKLVLDTVL